jgi:alcohol dehydrogenase (cytochrome c)
MRRSGFRVVWVVLAAAILTMVVAGPAWTIDPSRLVNAAKDPNSWLMYNGTYQGWRYSPVDQINRTNVRNLKVAWIFQPGMPSTEQGLEGTPLAVDGVIYMSGSYSRVWALDGTTGRVLWSYAPKIDMELRQRQTHVPYNRGIAVGHGNVYVGTIDGRLIALEMKSGKEVWTAPLVDSKKETVGFTGAPLVVKDMVVIGSQAGEWSTRGRIFAVDAKTGKEKWKFWTVGGPEDLEAQKTWGGDSWKVGGGGGWMTGSYDAELNLIFWGTGNASPLYDWAADKWKTEGPRPGTNLYITSVIALDADTGKLKWYFQELPHDPWDFDSAVGELLMLDKGGQKLLVHANKGGPVFVWDRTNGKVQNAYMGNHVYNFVKGVNPKTGELISPWYPTEGKTQFLCPWIAGAYSWNSGAYSPKTGLWYKIVQEGCMDLDIKRTQATTDPAVGLNIGADFALKGTPNGPAYGHLDARDPVTGAVKWSVNYPVIPIGSLLATGGDLVFLGDFEGWVHAHDAETGADLWSFNNGSGHRGGIISYTAGGKQYVAVASGIGSLVADDFAKLWPERMGHYAHSAALVVFTLP